MFAHSLVHNLQQTRQFIKQQMARRSASTRHVDGTDPSLRRAQMKAADILNISQAELSDLMSGDSDDSVLVGYSFIYKIGLASDTTEVCRWSPY